MSRSIYPEGIETQPVAVSLFQKPSYALSNSSSHQVLSVFRFRLRSLLILVTLLAVLFGWLGYHVRRSRIEAQSAGEIIELGGSYVYDVDYDESVGEYLEQTNIGAMMFYRDPREMGIFSRVVAVDLSFAGRHAGPGEALLTIGGIDLIVPVEDDDLECLLPLRNLRWLRLENSKITDQGLQHLEPLARLEWLNLKGTSVTDQGVKELQANLPHCEILR